MKRKEGLLTENLNVILESITDGFLILDASWRFIYLNNLAAKLFGKKNSELQGKNIWKEYPHLVQSVIYKKYKNSAKTGKSASFEYYYSRVKKWFNVRLYPSKLGLLIYFSDITEKKRTELELEKYKERLEQAQKAGHIGIYEWNLNDDSVWWSNEEENLFGVAPGTFKGTSDDWTTTIHPEDRKRIFTELRKAFRGEKTWEIEFRVIHKDGSIHWLKGKSFIEYDTEGKAQRMIGVNYDITSRKLLEESLKFKEEASRVLSISLDYEKRLQTVSKLAIPHFADWAAVDMLDKKGNIQLVAVAHKDPKKVKWARELRKKNPPKIDAPTGVPKVLRTKESEFYPILTAEAIESTVKTKKDRLIIKKLGGISSVIIVPLIIEGKAIGAISFITTESKRYYNIHDLHIAQQIASRISLAIENAILYRRVKQQRERLNDLLANVPGVVWEAWGKPDDSDQKINFVSDYVTKMLGFTVKEWLEKPNFWLTIVHPEDKPRAAQEAAAIFKSGRGGISRFRWIKKNGETIWVEAHSFVIKDPHSKPTGMRGVTMDISERMQIEQRKDDFISMASHELKTPLTSIKVFTQILQKSFKKTDQTKLELYLFRMSEQVNKLTNLINDLLDVSKIEAGKLELRREKFQLQPLVTEVVENMQATMEEYVIKTEGKTARQVYGDRDRIGQVLINFLSNAIKYSPENKEICVRVKSTQKTITVSVEDKGVGIEKKHIPHLFERFYRVYDNTDRTFPGLGMGLYISAEIIKRHKGKIWAESRKGKSSTFYFSLPSLS